MCKLLALSVAQRGREEAGSRPASSRTLLRQARPDRCRVRAAETERTRAPSVGSTQTSPFGWAKLALVVHVHGLRPAPYRLLRSRPASSKAGLSHRTIQPNGRKDAPHRLLQPTHKTSTLWAVQFLRHPPTSLATHRRQPRVEPRLTAVLQLRRCDDSRGRHEDRGHLCQPSEDPARSWWSFDRGSSAQALPMPAFSTGTKLVAQPLTSSVAAICERSLLFAGPQADRQASFLPPFRQKRRLRRSQDAFPRRVLPPPGGSLAGQDFRLRRLGSLACALLSRTPRYHEQHATDPEMSRPRDRLPASLSPLEPHG